MVVDHGENTANDSKRPNGCSDNNDCEEQSRHRSVVCNNKYDEAKSEKLEEGGCGHHKVWGVHCCSILKT